MNMFKRIFLNLKFAVKGVSENKLRSLLTLLGILIGIGAVIALTSLGEGAQSEIISGLESLGTNVITINPGEGFGFTSNRAENEEFRPGQNFNRNGPTTQQNGEISTLSIDDYNYLRKEKKLDRIEFISPIVTTNETIKYKNAKKEYTVKGVSEQYNRMYTLRLSEGRFIEKNDIKEKNRVAVLGVSIFKKKKINLNSEIIIDGKKFKVVGLLQKSEETLFGNDIDNEIYVPYTKAPGYDSKEKNISTIALSVFDENDVEETVKRIENKLADFKKKNDDESKFNVISVLALVSQVEEITDTFTLLLVGIAAISLLVGGIGISNVMLITVTERTREIGIRKAVGARRSDILIQFLFESIILTLIGGAAGIVFGRFLGKFAGRLLELPTIVTIESILLATGISVFIGILFGFIPANTASKKNPIEALRYE